MALSNIQNNTLYTPQARGTAAVMDLYIMEIFYNKSLFDYG